LDIESHCGGRVAGKGTSDAARKQGMELTKANQYFDVLAARGRDSRLAEAVGTVQFDVDGVGIWSVVVDHGTIKVKPGPIEEPTLRLQISEEEFVRLARADSKENLLTALLRGAVKAHGDLRFGQKMQAILPLPDEWEG
jgi:hypothetical protein